MFEQRGFFFFFICLFVEIVRTHTFFFLFSAAILFIVRANPQMGHTDGRQIITQKIARWLGAQWHYVRGVSEGEIN